MKNISLKKVLAAVLAAGVLTMGTACSQTPEEPSSSEPSPSSSQPSSSETEPGGAETQAIEFWDMIWGSDAQAYESAVDKICAEISEDISAPVNVQYLPWDNFIQVFVTAVASGTAPDVATTGTTLPSQIHMMGGTMNLNSILEDWKAENNPILNVIPEKAFKTHTFDGELVALPWDIQAECITYRTDIFEECGITEEPKTFDEFLEVGRKIKEKRPDLIPLVAACGDHEVHNLLAFFLLQNGTNVISGDLKPNLASPEAMHVSEFIQTMYNEGVLSRSTASYTSAERDSIYTSGQAAMIFRHNLDNTVADINPEVWENSAVMNLIKGPDTDEPMGMAFFPPLLAFENDHPELTKEFVKSYAEHYLGIYTEGSRGTIPVRTDWYDNEVFQDRIHKDLQEKIIPYAVHPTWPAETYYDAYNQIEGELLVAPLVQEILMGNTDIEGLSKQIDEKIQSALDAVS